MKKKKMVNNIIIGAIVCILIILLIQWYKDISIKDKQKQSEYNTESLRILYDSNNVTQNNISQTIIREYEKEEIIKKYKGYNVLAKLEIPDIKLETYILEECTDESLNKAVAKFWGANPNQIGNCCIAGHNAPRNRNMFYHLKDLEKGDKLIISDNTVGIVEYEIYDIYKVLPEDVSSLSQQTEGRREITLITCTNNSQKRLIIKAREYI